MFINLTTKKVYCLPDDFEVNSKKLEDIKYNLDPIFTQEEIKLLDSQEGTCFSRANRIEKKNCRGLDGTIYYPGYIGLNNLGNTDYVNVVLQTL